MPRGDRGAAEDRPRVSVVVPVYNAGERLVPCLDSVFGQDLPAGALEIVAVDDGSTDGSGAVLDGYAAARPEVRVIHQANSGWAGRPRNVGTDAARGDYVFYLDADDRLAPTALRRMVALADEHGSDIVVVRSVPVRDGQPVRAAAMRRTTGDLDLERAFRQLTPHKLVRRSFLAEHGLRFPEGPVRLEDGILFSRAYLLARRISALGDDDYYLRSVMVEGGNISRRPIDVRSYAQSIATILDTVRELDADRDRAERIALEQYRAKALKFLRPQRFLGYGPERRAECVAALGELARTRIPPETEARLREPFRTRSATLRTGDVEAVTALARREAAPEPPPPAPRRTRVSLARMLLRRRSG